MSDASAHFTITLKDYPVFLAIGVLPQELVEAQDIKVSLRLTYSCSSAVWGQPLSKMLDYGLITQAIDKHSQTQESFDLVENYVQSLCVYLRDYLGKHIPECMSLGPLDLEVEKTILPSSLTKGGTLKIGCRKTL
ncbi:MAG: dihydroneopterin aldolase [Proteobacteria bacterium]|nr:dihydroneopterin aldolase [Pseudomonadota bacterium]